MPVESLHSMLLLQLYESFTCVCTGRVSLVLLLSLVLLAIQHKERFTQKAKCSPDESEQKVNIILVCGVFAKHFHELIESLGSLIG